MSRLGAVSHCQIAPLSSESVLPDPTAATFTTAGPSGAACSEASTHPDPSSFKMAGQESGEERGVWSFGYGSNMDTEALEAKKGVRLLRHCPAVLPGFSLAMGVRGFSHVEPGFACLRRAEGGLVHGVAFCMGREGEQVLDRAEGGGAVYSKETVELTAYSGERLQAFIYVSRADSGVDYLPSARYLAVLVIKLPNL